MKLLKFYQRKKKRLAHVLTEDTRMLELKMHQKQHKLIITEAKKRNMRIRDFITMCVMNYLNGRNNGKFE